MTTEIKEGVEDVQEAIRAGRAVRRHGPYRVQIGNERVEYRPFVIADPVPTGRQLLDLAGLRPVEEHIILQVLSDGLLEDLRLEETTDLRSKGVEKFLAFRSDRLFRFMLDGRQFEWGAPLISGLTLKKLAGVDPATYGVWLEVRGGEDKPIGNADLVNLAGAGVEKFFTGITQTTEG